MTRLQRRCASLAATVVGALGFVGLLYAGDAFPPWATPLRIVALAWFAGTGVLKLSLCAIPVEERRHPLRSSNPVAYGRVGSAHRLNG